MGTASPNGAEVGGLSTPRVLIGRTDALQRLVHAVQQTPTIAVIEGEAGIGKTRLVDELIASRALAGMAIGVGACVPTVTPFPLGPVVEAIPSLRFRLDRAELHPITGTLRALCPELIDVLPAPPPQPADPGAARHQLFRGVAALLQTAAPVLLVLEDIHWADPETVSLLSYLAAKPPPGVAILTTLRREELDSAPIMAFLGDKAGSIGTSIVLRPLAPDEVGAMAAGMLGQTNVSPGFAAALHARTSGLPFAVDELVRLIVEAADTADISTLTPADIEKLDLPSRLTDSVVARLRRLPHDAQVVVAAAAVLHHPYTIEIIGRVADVDPAGDGFGGAVRTGFLVQLGPTYAFRHDIAREVVYASMAPSERSALHSRAADALGAAQPDRRSIVELARHCGLAGRLDEWVRHAESSADFAAALGSESAAARLLMEVVRNRAVPVETRARLAIRAATVAVEYYLHDDAIPLVQELLTAPSIRSRLRGELEFELGRLLLMAERVDEAAIAFGAAVSHLDLRPGLQARAMASVAFAAMRENHEHLALAEIDRAWHVAQSQDDELARMIVAIDRATILLQFGRTDAREAVLNIDTNGGDGERNQQLARASVNIATGAMLLGYLDIAQEWLERGAPFAVEGSRMAGGLTAAALMLDVEVGQWAGLEERVMAFLHSPAGVGHVRLLGLGVAGALWAARGAPDVSSEIRAAVASSMATSPATAQFIARGVAALLRRDLGSSARPVVGDLAEAVAAELLAQHGWPTIGILAVPITRALLHTGRSNTVHQWLQELNEATAGRDIPSAHAALLHASGLAQGAGGHHDEAVDHLSLARDAWASHPNPFNAALASEDLGRELSPEDAGAAEGALIAALQTYESLGADWDARRVQRTLRELGVAVPSRHPRRAYGEKLSPREREVAELAARGMTNREIAEQLFLSPRTVDDHVSRAIRKLRVTSRRHLGAALANTPTVKP